MTEDRAERPNKSAQKRELAALQVLAERMLDLTEREFAELGVEQDLREALAQVRPMRASGARNRQLKHCVKLMDRGELAEVEAYLDNRKAQQVAVNQAFHAIERWRDRLIAGGDDVLSELLDQHPDLDRQHLRQLCRDAAREHKKGKPAGAGKKLFRFLREQVFSDNA